MSHLSFILRFFKLQYKIVGCVPVSVNKKICFIYAPAILFYELGQSDKNIRPEIMRSFSSERVMHNSRLEFLAHIKISFK